METSSTVRRIVRGSAALQRLLLPAAAPRFLARGLRGPGGAGDGSFYPPFVGTQRRETVVIPTGELPMGGDDTHPHEGCAQGELPPHTACLDRYGIDAHEVTNREYPTCGQLAVWRGDRGGVNGC